MGILFYSSRGTSPSMSGNRQKHGHIRMFPICCPGKLLLPVRFISKDKNADSIRTLERDFCATVDNGIRFGSASGDFQTMMRAKCMPPESYQSLALFSASPLPGLPTTKAPEGGFSGFLVNPHW